MIISDSKYTLKGLVEWVPRWKRNNWQTANREPVKNKDLWTRLDDNLAKLKQLRPVHLVATYIIHNNNTHQHTTLGRKHTATVDTMIISMHYNIQHQHHSIASHDTLTSSCHHTFTSS